MIKRLVFALLLAVQFGAIANQMRAEIPFPECLPCPEDPPQAR